MSLLRFYNPSISLDRPNVLECILKYGSSMAIGHGTNEFMQSLLHDIGVKAEILNWTFQVYRCKYYCEFQEGDDWHDHWPLVWKICIEVAGTLSPLPVRSFPFDGTDAFDSTWYAEKQPSSDAVVHCLVISDFDNEADLEEAQKVIADSISNGNLKYLKEKYLVDFPIFSQSVVLGKYNQLQIDLGKFKGSFFAQGADYAEEVIKLCRKLNGTVNFLDRV